MAVEIYLPEKVYIAPSQIHGFGVFAKSRIQKNEIIEECPEIVMDFSKNDTSFHILEDYRFDWPCGFDYKTDPEYRQKIIDASKVRNRKILDIYKENKELFKSLSMN